MKVPFPFTDIDSAKKRPALVISSEKYHVNHNHCIMAMITSAKQSSWVDDIKITDIQCIGLSSSSVIRMKIFSIGAKLIIEKLGTLNASDADLVIRNLEKYLIPLT